MRRHCLMASGTVCVIGAVSFSSAALAAAQTFNTALPVAKGELVFREQFFFIKSSDDPSPADRDLEVMGAVLVLGYGVTGDLAFFGALPVLDKSLELDTPEGRRIERGDTGIGDAILFGRYTVLRDDAPGRTFRVAPFVGLELPTDDDERDGFGRLPQPLQLGSGSWDPFFGVVGTWQTLDYQIDAQASYQPTTSSSATS